MSLPCCKDKFSFVWTPPDGDACMHAVYMGWVCFQATETAVFSTKMQLYNGQR